MAHKVRFRAVALDHFRDIDNAFRQRIGAAIDKLAENPRPVGATMLTGMPGARRIRVGDFRVLYSIDDDAGEVWIEDVRHRSKAYGGH